MGDKNKIFLISAISVFIITTSGLFFLQEYILTVGDKIKSLASMVFVVDNSATNLNGNLLLKDEFATKTPEPLENPPEIVKGIYVTSWSASRGSYVGYLANLKRTTEVNAAVIDIKDYSGYIAYDAEMPDAERYSSKTEIIGNINSVVNKLHSEGIYVIARITVFQDPVLAKARPDLAVHSKAKLSSAPALSGPSIATLWLDNKKLAWIDPAAKEYWDYIAALSKNALSHGFDELNYDYIRFPSDGKLSDMSFTFWDGKTPKHEVIKEFFRYLRQELPDAKLSVDLFGLSTISADDLGIGQVIEDAYEYFDYVCPMVYPSHYAHGFRGYKNPAAYPYEVISNSIGTAQNRLISFQQKKAASVEENEPQRAAKLRPWIQNFNLKPDLDAGIVYNAKMINLEMKAVQDSTGDDFSGFLVWNPSNIYTAEAFSLSGAK